MSSFKLLSPLYLVLSIHLLTAGIAPAESRQWTSSEGNKIDAELVDFDGTTVTLLMKGRNYRIPIGKLSEGDQTWLEDWKENREKREAESLELISGLRKNAPIEFRYATDTDGYFKGPFGKKLRKYYDDVRSIVDDPKRGKFMDCEESVAWKDQTALIFCPPSYTGDQTPHGIYINISAGDRPIGMPKGLGKVMEDLSMIYASPSGTSNARSDVRRIALVLDTLATLRKTYKIDESRIFVGGVSGGGAMSALIAVNYPEFRASLCQVRNFIIPHAMCVPYVEESDVRKIARRGQAYAWITGDKDSNHGSIVLCAKQFEDQGFVSKLFDVPGMGHTSASAKTFDEALRWAESASKAPAL